MTLVVVVATAALLAHHYGPWRDVAQKRLAGLALLGGPAVFFRPEALRLPALVPTLVFLGVIALIVPVIVLAARKPAHWLAYPEDRREHWDRRAELGNAATWFAYLVGYELFFRGLLLGTLTDSVGPWPALALTTAIYAAAHFDKPVGEGVGTLPMGFVFGLATLAAGSVWPAVLGHLVIAVTNDAAAIRWKAA